MARYFFHLFEGNEVFTDTEGTLCVSPEEISERALRDARAMLAEDLLRGQLRLDQRIEVTDSKGRLVHDLDFEAAFSVTPRAVSRPRGRAVAELRGGTRGAAVG